MMTSTAFVALAALTLAALAPSGGQAVVVEISSVKNASAFYMTVQDLNSSELLASLETTFLDVAGLTLTANVNGITGAGSLAIGATTYTIHEDPKYSGGISCARMYSSTDFFVSFNATIPEVAVASHSPLLVPVPNSIAAAVLPSLMKSLLTGETAYPWSTGNKTVNTGQVKQLGARQGACGTYHQGTKLVGNGNPHQNYWKQQVTDTLSCGAAATCTIGQDQSFSYSIGFSTGSADAFEWIDGGFSVEISFETTISHQCQANSGQTVCLWQNTPHTAYTVQNYAANQCSGQIDIGDPYVMFSPDNNVHGNGGGAYCVVGTCRNQGDAYWNYNGPASGPVP